MSEEMSMSDHDLLIRVNTQLENVSQKLDAILPLIQDLEKRVASVEESRNRHSEKLTAIRGDVNALRLEKLNAREIESLKGDIEDLKKKSNTWDIINSVGVGLLAVLDYFLRR